MPIDQVRQRAHYLSHTYNSIKGSEQSPDDWNIYIRSVDKKLVLMGDPDKEFSKREVDKLEEVSDRFKDISTRGLSAFTHGFPEWISNFEPDTSRTIPWKDAIAGVVGAERIAVFEEKLTEQELIDSILGSPTDAVLAQQDVIDSTFGLPTEGKVSTSCLTPLPEAEKWQNLTHGTSVPAGARLCPSRHRHSARTGARPRRLSQTRPRRV